MEKSSEFVVSAIVSTYNSERFIEGRLRDLVKQTLFSQTEIIVIDSGSQQGEKAIVERFQQRYSNIKYLRTERETLYAAWNRGIKMATGKYITNANTDDRLRPDAYEVMVNALDLKPDIALVYADVLVTTGENETFICCDNMTSVLCWSEFDLKKLFVGCFVGPQPMWRRDVHDKYGLFDAEYVSAGDYEFWLRIAKHESFLHIKQPLGLYLKSEESIAHKDSSLTIEETQRCREKYWDQSWGTLPKIEHKPYIKITRYAQNSPNSETVTENLLNKLAPLKTAPMVSVILPTFNRPLLFIDALDSVFSQSYPHWEVIIINDGGQDVSHLLQPYDGSRITLVQLPLNHGPSAARNAGLLMAKGDMICFLDDDDIFHQDHVQALVDALCGHPTPLAYTDGAYVDEILEEGKRKEIARPAKYYQHDMFDMRHLYVSSYIPATSWGFRRECFLQIGGFMTNLAVLEDWEWLLRLSQYGTPLHIKKTTVTLRKRKKPEGQHATLNQPLLEPTYKKICQMYFSDDLTEENQRRNNFLSCLYYEYRVNQLFKQGN